MVPLNVYRGLPVKDREAQIRLYLTERMLAARLLLNMAGQ